MNSDTVDTSSDTSSEIAALRNQVFNLLVALIVVSGTLTLFLYRQASVSGKDIDVVNHQIDTYKQAEPAIMSFVNQLGAYGMTHSDIRPILSKYGIVVAPTQPAPQAPKP
jgi:hypothetical protein